MAKRYASLNFQPNFKSKKARIDNVIRANVNQVVRINGGIQIATRATAVIDDDEDELRNLNLPGSESSFNFTANSFSEFQQGAPQCSTQDQVSSPRNHVPTQGYDDDLEGDVILSQLNIDVMLVQPDNQKKKETFLAPKPPSARPIGTSTPADQTKLSEIRRQKAAEQKTQFLEKKLDELKKELTNQKILIEDLKDKLQGKDGEMSTVRYENENLKLQNEKLLLGKIQETECVKTDLEEKIKTLYLQLQQKETEMHMLVTKKRKENDPRPMDFLQIAKLCVPKINLFKEFHVPTDVWYSLQTLDTESVSPEVLNLIKLQTIIGLLQRPTQCDIKHLEEVSDIILCILENTETRTRNLKKFNMNQYKTSPAYVEFLLRNVTKTVNRKLCLENNSPIHSSENIFDEKAMKVVSFVFLSKQFCSYLQSRIIIFKKIVQKLKIIVQQILTTANIGEQSELITSVAAILQNMTSNLTYFAMYRTEILDIFQLIAHSCICNINCFSHLARFLHNYALHSPQHLDQLCNGRPEMKKTIEKMTFNRGCCGLVIFGAKLKETIDIIGKKCSSSHIIVPLTDVCYYLINFILCSTKSNPHWLKERDCKCLNELTAAFLSTLFECMNIFAKDSQAINRKMICGIAQSATSLFYYLFKQTSAKETWKSYPELKDYFGVAAQMILEFNELLDLEPYHLKCLSSINVAVITTDVSAMRTNLNESTGERKVNLSIENNFINWRNNVQD